jgi:hypothetical protein
LWTAIPTGNETLSNCVTLGLSKNGSSAQLSLAACSESKSLMCQVYEIDDKFAAGQKLNSNILTAKMWKCNLFKKLRQKRKQNNLYKTVFVALWGKCAQNAVPRDLNTKHVRPQKI